jgi:hypothetical protein
MNKTTQEQYVQLAWSATAKAEQLARDAERARRPDPCPARTPEPRSAASPGSPSRPEAVPGR